MKMSLEEAEFCIILGVGGIIWIIGMILILPPNNSKKDIPPAIHYSTVEHNGHTYIQNRSGSFFVHNIDCTNSKCFKE